MKIMKKLSLDLKILDKYYARKAANFILGKRYCQKCAKKAWKNEKNDQTLKVLMSICSKCGKAGMVAYIDHE